MRKSDINSRRRMRSGQTLIGMVISLTFMFGVMGLSIDLGYAYYLKTRVQTAADAAASAAGVYASNNGDSCSGAGAVSCGTAYTCAGVTPPTNSLQAGCLYATTDGPPSLSATMLENSTAPPGTSNTNPAMWIKATVSTTAPNFFLFGSGFHVSNVTSSAIAGVTSIAPGACIYLLSANASPALSISGTSTLTTTSCGVYINSNAAAAMSVTGSARIISSQILINGGYSAGPSTQISPAPTTGAGSVPDPLANLPAPSFSGCDHTNYSVGHSDIATIGPGVYCGGISVSGAAHLTLTAGTYILNGGGLSVGNSGVLSGAGVTFFNTAAGGYTAAVINCTGASTTNVSAPTSGTYKGILFYQDRNVTYAGTNTFANSATGTMTGTFYFPTTAVSYTGNVASAVYQAFVASKLTIAGSSSLTNDTVGTFTGLVRTGIGLIQ